MAKKWELENIMRSIDSGDLKATIDGRHPWQRAIEHRNQELVECLVKNGRVNEAFVWSTFNKEGYGKSEPYSPLRFACERWPDVAEYLLKNHADVNQLNYGVCAPLTTAINCVNEKLVKLLIENQADLNQVNLDSQSISTVLSSKNYPAIHALMDNVQIDSKVVFDIFSRAVKNIWNIPPGISIPALSATRILAEDGKYNFDHIDSRSGSTVLNIAMINLYHCNEVLVRLPDEPSLIMYAKELTSEALILLANNPNMTKDLVETTIATSHKDFGVGSQPKIGEIFTKSFFEEHPYWSIYRSEALLQELSSDAQDLSAKNCLCSVELKAGIDETLESHIPVKDLAALVLGYAFVPDVDFSAAEYFEKLAGQLIEEGYGAAASAAAYEG